jgi:hypothetical protein
MDALTVITPPLNIATSGENSQIGQFEIPDIVYMPSGRIN